MNGDLEQLIASLGYCFKDGDLLAQALTHRSLGATNNERLEFLGDALIGFVIAETLVAAFPDADEGTLSRMRASLVKRDALAGLARALDLGPYLRLGSGELRTGGHTRDSILADALEAVFGAVYLDSDYASAREVALRLFRDPLSLVALERAGKDPKTRLQELLQARRRPLPEYEVVAIHGDQHAQSFVVACVLPDDRLTSRGEGSSRRRAEQDAAAAMLERIDHV